MGGVWGTDKPQPGALPKARKRHLAGSAHGMTTLVEAEGMNRRSPAAPNGPGDALARRGLVGVWRGFRCASWLSLQTGAIDSGDVLLASSLRLPVAHGRDGVDLGPAGAFLVPHQTDYLFLIFFTTFI